MSVKFNKPKSGASQYLKIGSNGAKYKIEGNSSWKTTEIVYFMFIEESSTNKYWRQTTADVESKITQLSGEISAKVSSNGGADGFGWNLTESGFTLTSTIGNVKTDVLTCDKNGIIIKGKIAASEASTVAGWKIGEYKIYGGGDAEAEDSGLDDSDPAQYKGAVMQIPGYPYKDSSGNEKRTKWVFAAGGTTHDAYGDYPFRVDAYGKVYAKQIYLRGSRLLKSDDGIVRWK